MISVYFKLYILNLCKKYFPVIRIALFLEVLGLHHVNPLGAGVNLPLHNVGVNWGPDVDWFRVSGVAVTLARLAMASITHGNTCSTHLQRLALQSLQRFALQHA